MQEAEENVLNDVLDACTKEGGSAEDQLKRALQMLQQVGVCRCSWVGVFWSLWVVPSPGESVGLGMLVLRRGADESSLVLRPWTVPYAGLPSPSVGFVSLVLTHGSAGRAETRLPAPSACHVTWTCVVMIELRIMPRRGPCRKLTQSNPEHLKGTAARRWGY